MAPRDDELAHWTRDAYCEVPQGKAGQRLDTFLARTFPYRSRTRWAVLVRTGRIRVNDSTARPGRGLQSGDRIEYVHDPRPEPQISRAFRVIHEDPWLLAVRKPANLPVHPAGRYFRNTLLWMLLEQRGEPMDATALRIVHRLDRETSGLILFGKGREAASLLARQFENREVRKQYLAIVHGLPRRDRFVVDAPIGPDRASTIRNAMTVLPEGQPARTSFRVVRRGPEHALLIARPQTGRLHQIRVHLRHTGHPIIGDKIYGLDPALFLRFVTDTLSPQDRRRLLWRRQALHAWKLSFHHPDDGRPVKLRAPVGSSWLNLASRLGL